MGYNSMNSKLDMHQLHQLLMLFRVEASEEEKKGKMQTMNLIGLCIYYSTFSKSFSGFSPLLS